jgi:peptide/nickel transport system permease protein
VSGYLVRRLVQSVVVVIGVMILTFLLLHLEPGSVARAILGNGVHVSQLRLAMFDSLYGLNKPLYVQFGIYVQQLLHGNLGVSYQSLQPVSTLIAQRLPRDAVLVGLSTLVALFIGIPTGIYQALRHNQLMDDVLAGTWFTLYAAPDFMEALLLIALLCVQFHVFPPAFPGGVTSVGGLFANWQALVLPVAVLSINSVAGFSQYVRSTAIQTLAEDYVRVSRAKGLPERLVVTRHVLRNSLLPVVTILGLSLPDIVAGALIAEAIFNFPGMGLLFWQSALAHDYPVMLGGTLIIGVATVLGNFAADIAYSVLDPRIRYGRA